MKSSYAAVKPHRRSSSGFTRFAVAIALAAIGLGAFRASAAAPSPAAQIDARVGLSSLVALSDGHLIKIADTMRVMARGLESEPIEWPAIKPLLEQLQAANVACVPWFARPDGSYWTLDGRQTQNLRERPYFSRLLAGTTVIGDLVVSKSAKRPVAIVAVPIFQDNAVVGAFGASVYLDKLSAQLRSEMTLPDGTIFYSFDSNALVALNWDKSLIFLEPRKVSRDLDRAFSSMLAHSEGRQTYTFRGQKRSVLYRKSTVTGWWYAIGSASGA